MEIKDIPIDVDGYCVQVRRHLRYQSRERLIHLQALFRV